METQHKRQKRKERDKLEGDSKFRKLMLDFVYLRDKGICYACGLWLPREDATREHLKPLREFPELGMDADNIALAHESCNR